MSQSTIPEPMPLDDFDPDPPSWPKVIGWISTGVGAFGLSCLACSAVGVFATPFMMQGQPGIDPNNLPPNMTPSPLMLVQMGLGAVLSVVQIIAGVLTINRQKSGRIVHLVWAGLGIVSGIVGLIIQVRLNQGFKDWVAANPSSPLARGGGGGPMVFVGYACSAVLGIGYPIFILVWFGVIKTTHAQMLRREKAEESGSVML